jgi:hypothetical protein
MGKKVVNTTDNNISSLQVSVRVVETRILRSARPEDLPWLVSLCAKLDMKFEELERKVNRMSEKKKHLYAELVERVKAKTDSPHLGTTEMIYIRELCDMLDEHVAPKQNVVTAAPETITINRALYDTLIRTAKGDLDCTRCEAQKVCENHTTCWEALFNHYGIEI